MQRVLVMGPPGSGKSTLARIIGQSCSLPVFHLDQAFWQPGWIQTPTPLFQAEVERLAHLPKWVIEGNYTHAIAPRLAAADTLIYIDAPTWLCLLRILRRTASGLGTVRPDAAKSCPERWDIPFLRYATAWNRTKRAAALARAAAFPGRTLILKPGTQLRRFQATLPNQGTAPAPQR